MWQMMFPRVQRVNQTLMAHLAWTLIMTTQSLVAAVPHTQKTGESNFLFLYLLMLNMTFVLICR